MLFDTLKNGVLFILIGISVFPFQARSQTCAGFPKFAKKLGFIPERCALSSSERRSRGIKLVEYKSSISKGGDTIRTYKHPSWDKAGFLGPITRDEYGNSYVSPLPAVNTMYNKLDEVNTIFKIDTDTGEMKPWVNLPFTFNATSENCFGILGMYYDCFTQKLIVSSVVGSNRNSEKGAIYSVDVKTDEVKTIIKGIDAIGVTIFRQLGQTYLCFGSARTSQVYSVVLDSSLNPLSSVQLFLSLEGYGPRGDDKARRIRFDQDNLVIEGTPFYYNLSTANDFQESKYVFQPNQQGLWKLKAIN